MYSQQNSAIDSIASILANVNVSAIIAAGGNDLNFTTGGNDLNFSTGINDLNFTTGGNDLDFSTGGNDLNFTTGGNDLNFTTGGNDLNLTTIETVSSTNSPVPSMRPVDIKTNGNKRKNVRIVGGKDYTINQVPWQVSIQLSGSHFCGGTLINSKTVVTAAHCCVNQIANQIQIRANSAISNKGGVTSKIAKIIAHPSYDKDTTDNDICILKLSTAIKTTYAELPQNRIKVPVELDGVLRSVYQNGFIKRMYKLKGISKNMIFPAGPGKDACQGLS